MIEILPPAIILLVGAGLVGLTRGYLRDAIVLLAPLITIWAVWQVPEGVTLSMSFINYQIEPIEGNAVRRLFALIFSTMAFVGGIYAFRQASRLELSAAYAYAAGAIGVAFAGDLITLFLFWEMMAIFSTVIVWCGGTLSSSRAGMRYAIMHVLGGVILMAGIAGVAIQTGSIDIRALQAEDFSTWLILIGSCSNSVSDS